MAKADSLATYKSKRNFAITPEPAEGGTAAPDALQFVVQKHWASRLHYDFRIELDGAMKSWAVPKGPSFDPADKRMAVHVEDHPISYNAFEGQIPEKQYGAGKVIIWDKGIWIPLEDPHKGYETGKLKFELRGHKLHGKWTLIRMHTRNEKQDAWLLIKEKDDFVRPASEFSVVDELPDSVAKLGLPKGVASRAEATARSATAKPAASRSMRPTEVGKAGKADGAAIKTTTGKKRGAVVMPEGAVKAALPATLSPVLATLVDGPPTEPGDWLFEIKFDGYRMLARIGASHKVQMFTRNGHDWTQRMPALAAQIERMKLAPGWLDGEIVVMNDEGTPDFQALQNAFDTERMQDVIYYLFDLPYYAGHDLRGVPLIERRALLQSVLKNPGGAVRFSDVFEGAPADMLKSACQLGLEGIIGKRKSSTYSSRRSPDWIKLKCSHRQEFVIGGFTDPKGTRVGIGSLLLGVHDDDGNLLYAGNVGTGFNTRFLGELRTQLDTLATDKRPFKNPTENDRKAHWVKPTLLAEVTFAEWTKEGRIRHAVFHALRSDKPAKAILREKPMHVQQAEKEAAAGGKGKAGRARASTGEKAASTKAPGKKAGNDAADDPEVASTLPAGFKVTHGDRVIDASTGITKVELVRFYGLVAPLMMEHLKGRPVSLVRAPSGIEGELFFQKHMERSQMEGIKLLDPSLDRDHDPLLEVAAPLGLLSAAQMNVVEFHTWNAVKTAIDKPDRMTFDLDPGEGVKWPAMQQAAELVRVFLDQLGLAGFVKTSGGKGLHVVVPLKRRYDWDTVKDFSQAIVQHLANTLPQQFVAKSGPRNRVGKIFIDYLRNGFGATTACAWSARARKGMGVSVPVAWDELPALISGDQWTVRNIHTRLDLGNTPWADYAKAAQNITQAMKTLGFTR